MNLQTNMRRQANMLVQILSLQDLLVRVRLPNENAISKFYVVRHVNVNPDIVVGDDTCNDMDVPRAMKYTDGKGHDEKRFIQISWQMLQYAHAKCVLVTSKSVDYGGFSWVEAFWIGTKRELE
jgi:hypothetical protein